MPAGTWHNATNIGDEPLQLDVVSAPVHHASGKIHATAADADRDEDSGDDVPRRWSVQPAEQPSDEHVWSIARRPRDLRLCHCFAAATRLVMKEDQ